MKPKTIQQALYSFFEEKPIAYHPRLSQALGSVKAGLFVAQCLYWCGKGSDPEWFYKTVHEFEKETGLTRKEQETAIRICKEKGIMETKLKQIPAKRHFKLHLKELKQLCLSSYESDELPSKDGEISTMPISPSITETTSNNNQDINKLNKLKQLKREVFSNALIGKRL